MAIAVIITLLFAGSMLPPEQEDVILRDDNTLSDFQGHLYIMEDMAGDITIEELRAGNYDRQFKRYESDSELNGESVYWGRLKLRNESGASGVWMLYVGKNDFIEAYLITQNDFKLVRTGYQLPASQRALPRSSYTLPLNLQNGIVHEIYLRIEEDIHSDPQFDLNIMPAKVWVEEETNKHWLDLFFQGFFWIMALYSFLVFITSREKTNLYYTLYLISVAIFYLFITGILREYLIAENPAWTPYFMSTLALASFFYCAFMRPFLNTPENLPRWDRIVRVIMIIDFAAFFLLLILNGIQEILLATRFAQIVVMLTAFVGLGTIFLLWKSNSPVARFFMAGTAVFVLSVLFDTGFWDPGSSEAVVTRFGLACEILLFSVGLGQRIRIIGKEKQQAQSELIHQLKLNEQLIAERREELEHKIKERTRQLEEKNKELTEAKNAAEQASRVKSDFLSVMSHEIRTPMNAVIGMTHILLEENPKPDQLENLKTLKFSAESLLILINDILDYSKIESGKVQLENVDFDLNEVIRGINYMFRPKAQSNGIQFSILLDHETTTALNGDPARLTQILNNLISNAIKFTKEGRVTLYIHLVKKSKEVIDLKFVVEDTGIGIEKDKLKVIFDTFTQASFDTTRKFGGTGLGLSITKRLLDLFNSGIEVESKPGNGSKFSFTLSLKPGKAVSSRSKDEYMVKKDALLGMNILVVDDNLVNRIMVERFLSKWKITCHGVASGREALEIILDEDFDLILLDLQMPEMDGYEVARTIRGMKSERFISLPIIAISADTLTNVYDKVLSAGMDDFLSKPFNPNELFNLVYSYSQLIKTR